MLAPLKTLDGHGALRSPPPTAEPIKASELQTTSPSFEHPPGYYGQSASPRALNVLTPKSTLVPFPELPASVTRLSYANAASTALKPACSLLALALLFADIIAVILLQAGGLGGLFSRRPRPRADRRRDSARRARLCRQFPTPEPRTCRRSMRFRRRRKGPERSRSDRRTNPPPTRRPSPRRATSRSLTSLSGDRETDDTSRAGLAGLGRVLETRTAVEPGEPAAVDISKDEIAFYPDPLLARARARPRHFPIRSSPRSTPT